jgi:hypothetical protein
MAAALAVVVWTVLSPAAMGANNYLHTGGPVPLRFEGPPPAPREFIMPTLLLPPAPPKQTNEAANVTNIVPDNTTVEKPLNLNLFPFLDDLTNSAGFLNGSLKHYIPSTPPEEPFSMMSLPSGARTPTVTPQMLTEFFRPSAQGSTNRVTTVVVPVESVGFTPPTPKAPATGSAQYETK